MSLIGRLTLVIQTIKVAYSGLDSRVTALESGGGGGLSYQAVRRLQAISGN